ncbi:unnamed protein product [Phytophthora fragariaefolia]|uniref:Unnamed protein product n=1 Tax=Phytophthora fragariaefolia TaxID=1490495 RepID=A0A9W6YLV2_9STRA|nr:unnamed protein product [Phytophthora fragariaefolia]
MSRTTPGDTHYYDRRGTTKLPRLNRRRTPRDNPHVPSGQEGLLLGRSVCHGNTARPCLRRLQHQQRETPFKELLPGNVLAERPFQLLSMDFVTPLPKTRQGNTSLLLFQCSFTGYVITKAMSRTKAQDVAELLANGQQKRSVKSIVQTVNVYVEDPLQQDWDDIAEKMTHVINNSMDMMRKETHFYLVHGLDAQSTLKAMTSSLRLSDGSLTDATALKREANRQHEVALAMANQYQATVKARRPKVHNEALGRLERMALELPGKARYRFYPVVHVSRLKPVREDKRRPTAELVDGLGEDDRFEFDEVPLPEDSWEPEAGGDEYVVEAILDDRWPISTGTERNQREFCVKLQTKVSNHARYPSVVGTGHRAWEKATVPHDNLGEGGHRSSPRPENGVIRATARWGKPPQTPRLVDVDTGGLGDPISRPREPWKIHRRADRIAGSKQTSVSTKGAGRPPILWLAASTTAPPSTLTVRRNRPDRCFHPSGYSFMDFHNAVNS